MIERGRIRGRPPTSRRGVATDTLVILGGALLAVFIAQSMLPTSAVGPDNSSPDPNDTGIVVGGDSASPDRTLPPIPTIGPVVNPSAHFDATPTPIPIITLAPPTPTPSIEPSLGPTAKPTPKPTVKPTAPPPSAAFTCIVTDLSISCTAAGTNGTSWTWDWGDPLDSTPGSGKTAGHTYPSPNTYTVSLTASGPGGKATSSKQVTVTAPLPSPSL